LEKFLEYLKKAASPNPAGIASRLELARSDAAEKQWPEARVMPKTIPEIPAQFSDDAKMKQQAEQLLEELKDR
jgi:hypothetical protein